MLQIWDTCQYLSHDDESVSLGGSFVLSFQSWTLSDLSGLPIPALSLASTNRLSLSSQQMGTGVSKSLLYILNLFLTTSYSEITRPTWRVDTGMSVGSDPGPAKRTRIVTSASLTALPVVTQYKEVKALFILILKYFINLNPFQHSQINLEAFLIIII